VARRKKSLMDSGNATGFVLEMIYLETSALLRIADETCQRYPPATNLHFVRYLLRMIVLETEEEMKERRH
jgi:hypothetical protein